HRLEIGWGRKSHVGSNPTLSATFCHLPVLHMASKPLYRVAFLNQGEVYEVYARSVSQGGLYGFVELEELVFHEKTQLVIDPAEDKLAAEFADVTRTYIPMHAVLRIDQVTQRGKARVRPADGDSKVHPFPVYTRGDGPKRGS